MDPNQQPRVRHRGRTKETQAQEVSITAITVAVTTVVTAIVKLRLVTNASVVKSTARYFNTVKATVAESVVEYEEQVTLHVELRERPR